MAKAHKLPSGSWRCQCYAGKDANGRPQYRSFTRPTKKEAATEYVVNIKGNCLYQRLKTILRKNSLPDIRFHDLRHTAASVMLMLNVPDKYAQQRGGWSTPATMKNVYQHTLASKRSAVDDAIDVYFNSLIQPKAV